MLVRKNRIIKIIVNHSDSLKEEIPFVLDGKNGILSLRFLKEFNNIKKGYYIWSDFKKTENQNNVIFMYNKTIK